MKNTQVIPQRIPTGSVVKAGDILLYGERNQFSVVVGPCKYDPGCCVGHVVEAHELYLRV